MLRVFQALKTFLVRPLIQRELKSLKGAGGICIYLEACSSLLGCRKTSLQRSAVPRLFLDSVQSLSVLGSAVPLTVVAVWWV